MTHLSFFIGTATECTADRGLGFEQTSFNGLDWKEMVRCEEVFQCTEPSRASANDCNLHDVY